MVECSDESSRLSQLTHSVVERKLRDGADKVRQRWDATAVEDLYRCVAAVDWNDALHPVSGWYFDRQFCADRAFEPGLRDQKDWFDVRVELSSFETPWMPWQDVVIHIKSGLIKRKQHEVLPVVLERDRVGGGFKCRVSHHAKEHSLYFPRPKSFNDFEIEQLEVVESVKAIVAVWLGAREVSEEEMEAAHEREAVRARRSEFVQEFQATYGDSALMKPLTDAVRLTTMYGEPPERFPVAELWLNPEDDHLYTQSRPVEMTSGAAEASLDLRVWDTYRGHAWAPTSSSYQSLPFPEFTPFSPPLGELDTEDFKVSVGYWRQTGHAEVDNIQLRVDYQTSGN